MPTIHIRLRGRSLLERILFGIVALAFAILLFFFLAAALAIGAVALAAILVRLWWMRRKLRRAAEADIISTEYTVVEREALPRPGAVEPREVEPPRKAPE